MHPYHGPGDLAAGAVQIIETPAPNPTFTPPVAGPATGGSTTSPVTPVDDGIELDAGMRGADEGGVNAILGLESGLARELGRTPLGTETSPDGGCTNGLADGQVIYGPMQQAHLDGSTGSRASGVQACIVATRPSKPRKPTTPFGFGPGMDRSHLLAYTLFGNNSKANIVPLYRDVNRIDMRSIERTTAAAVAGGQKVAYDVTPIYEGDSPIPVAIQVRVMGTGGFKCNVIIFNLEGSDGQRSGC